MNEAGAHPLPMLELRAVGKRYGATVALEDVSLSVPAGEICGVPPLLLGQDGGRVKRLGNAVG